MSEDDRQTGTSTSPHKESMNVDTPTPEAEAGPSRIRRSSTTTDPTSDTNPAHSNQLPRPSSPSNTLPDEPNGDVSEAVADKKEEDPPRTTPYLDLASYPTQQLIRMLASLLQQIASANDQLRPDTNDDQDEDGMGDENSSSSGTRSRADSRTSNSTSQPPTSSTSTPNPPAGQAQSLVNPALNPAHPSPTTALFSEADAAIAPSTGLKPKDPTRRQSTSPTTGRAETLFTASKSSLNHRSSLLSFHARHIPSISIEAYLLRILKYCPTTNEVFLGLLVYFDRMSRLGTPGGLGGMTTSGKGFAIDSYNVHRLVIAGVTVASKFFSDVFYTNSRYAKVGGLPPHELNQLELQFLLLNDFRLVIPYDEMQRYGNRLLGYWENKEAEEKNASLSNSGAELPTEEQAQQAQAQAATTPAVTDSNPKNDEDSRPASNGGEATPSRPQSQPQSEPKPTERDDRPFHPSASRTASFDPAAPANAQAPITTA